jgi:hypothetical protein
LILVRCACLAGASLAGCAACWWAAGTSLGLFFEGLFIATFFTPAAVLEQGTLRDAIACLGAAIAPVAIVWLIAVIKSPDTIEQWMAATTVLITYSLAIAGMAMLPSVLKLPPVLAAAAAIVIGFAWLTWPVWLSATLAKGQTNAVVNGLVIVHPPLVINGILSGEPAWTEMSLAYHLTNLNQDVPVRLPGNIWVCVAFHGIAGIGLWAAAVGIANRRRGLYPVENLLLREKS